MSVGRRRTAVEHPVGDRAVVLGGAERAQDHIELGLELRDSNELDAQLAFSIGKPLVDGPERFRGGAASNRARSRVW